jgi:uncharacterized OB-fold protein
VARILPEPDETSEFYWRAAARGELAILRCRACRRFVHPPRTPCPSCRSTDLAPERVSGRGTIHTFTISHHPASGLPSPLALVLVELEEQEGVRILAELRGCPPGEVRVGLPVEVEFEDVGEGVKLPQFRLTRSRAVRGDDDLERR